MTERQENDRVKRELAWYALAAWLALIVMVASLHRHDRTVVCREDVVGGQVYANHCVARP